MESSKPLAAGHCLSKLEHLLVHSLEESCSMNVVFMRIIADMQNRQINGTADEFAKLIAVIEEDAQQLGLQSHICVTRLLDRLIAEAPQRSPYAAGIGGSVMGHPYGLSLRLSECSCA
jgi:hypothetical protein